MHIIVIDKMVFNKIIYDSVSSVLGKTLNESTECKNIYENVCKTLYKYTELYENKPKYLLEIASKAITYSVIKKDNSIGYFKFLMESICKLSKQDLLSEEIQANDQYFNNLNTQASPDFLDAVVGGSVGYKAVKQLLSKFFPLAVPKVLPIVAKYGVRGARGALIGATGGWWLFAELAFFIISYGALKFIQSGSNLSKTVVKKYVGIVKNNPNVIKFLDFIWLMYGCGDIKLAILTSAIKNKFITKEEAQNIEYNSSMLGNSIFSNEFVTEDRKIKEKITKKNINNIMALNEGSGTRAVRAAGRVVNNLGTKMMNFNTSRQAIAELEKIREKIRLVYRKIHCGKPLNKGEAFFYNEICGEYGNLLNAYDDIGGLIRVKKLRKGAAVASVATGTAMGVNDLYRMGYNNGVNSLSGSSVNNEYDVEPLKEELALRKKIRKFVNESLFGNSNIDKHKK